MHSVRALAVLFLLLCSCPKPPVGPVEPGTPSKLVTCGAQAVQTCAAGAVPAINQCLAGIGDVTSCLLGLIKPGACITYEVIACVVRHEGNAARAAYQNNPDDARDGHRAKRAEEYLAGQGIKFAD
jgi:hypothetical protein